MLTKLIIKKTPATETFLSREEGDQWSRRRRRVSRYANQFHAHTKKTDPRRLDSLKDAIELYP